MSLMYMVQLKYTKDALMAIIDQQQDRMAAAEALCESIGGKLHGMWGVTGQDYHMFAIVEAPSEVAYMSAYMKLMKSGACLLYTSPSPRDTERSRMPSSA